MTIHRGWILFAAALLMSACDGGGDIATGGSDTAGAAVSVSTAEVETVTLTYPSGRVQASGALIAGTNRRTGSWTTYFDDESGQRQWEGSYRDGVIDTDKPWQEWNRDGSLRFDSTDQ